MQTASAPTATPALTPTPTHTPGLAMRHGDFGTLTEALDYAARGLTGYNFYDSRGKLDAVLAYRDLRDRAVSHATRLSAAGIKPGDRVALLAATAPEFVTMFFACQYAGIIPVPMPLPTAFGRREAYIEQIKNQIGSSSARMVIGPQEFLPLVKEAAAGFALELVGTIDDVAALPEGKGMLQPGGTDDLSYIQYSSGSTRFPTGVMVTHKSLLANSRGMSAFGVKHTADERGMSWLPFFHDMGLVGFVLAPLTSQAAMDYLPTEDFARRPLTWLKIISDNGGTVSYGPCFGYELCARRVKTMAEGSLGFDLSHWRVAGIGGEMIKPPVLRLFAEAFAPYGFDAKAFNASYGLAECVLGVSITEPGTGMKLDHISRDEMAAHRAVPVADDDSAGRSFVLCGKVIPDHKVEVRGEDGAVLSERGIGRVFVFGPSVMKGYYNNPEDTEAALQNGWLDTGDLGYFVGDELVIVGRAKDMMIVNGRNVWPQDIEWTVEHMEGMRSGDSAAIVLVDADGTEKPTILVQCRPADPATRAQLAADVKAKVQEAVGIACDVVLVPARSLPKTTSGKLARGKAKTMYIKGEIQPFDPNAPSTPDN